MTNVICFPIKEPLSPEKEYEAMWRAIQDQIFNLIKEGGFHIDYAAAESRRIIFEAKARRERLEVLGKLDSYQINDDMVAFVTAQVREAVGLKPKVASTKLRSTD